MNRQYTEEIPKLNYDTLARGKTPEAETGRPAQVRRPLERRGNDCYSVTTFTWSTQYGVSPKQLVGTPRCSE